MAPAHQEDQFQQYALRGGMNHSAKLLREGGAMTVAFLGGSVTAGAGSSDAERTSYRALICHYLESKYPGTTFTFINAAIGGTDSTYGAFRLEEHVFRQGPVDLLFVDFAVNDTGNRNQSLRALEGIIRRARRLCPLVDICLLYMADKGGFERFTTEGLLQTNVYHHEEAADYYRIPSVNLAEAIYSRLKKGRFSWGQFSLDEVHPLDFGYSLYAAFIIQFLNRALQADPWGLTDDKGGKSPIDTCCYENGHMISPLEVIQATGWKMIGGWSATKICNWSPPSDIFAGEQPGDRFQFEFSGTAFGISLLAGMDTGDIEIALNDGPCRMISLFDRHCLDFYRPKIVLLADGLIHGRHKVTLRISQSKHPQSTGHAIRILRLLVNGSVGGTNGTGLQQRPNSEHFDI